jgi:spore coat protein U-like protein
MLRRVSGFLAIGLIGLSSNAFADTVDVTADVPDACTVSAGALAFGTYAPDRTTALAAAGSFDVVCSLASTVDIALDAGGNIDSNVRRMSNGTGGFLSYEIFDAGNTQKIGDNSTILEQPLLAQGLGVGTTTITLNGQAAGNQQPPGGNYSDTVQVSLTFN